MPGLQVFFSNAREAMLVSVTERAWRIFPVCVHAGAFSVTSKSYNVTIVLTMATSITETTQRKPLVHSDMQVLSVGLPGLAGYLSYGAKNGGSVGSGGGERVSAPGVSAQVCCEHFPQPCIGGHGGVVSTFP